MPVKFCVLTGSIANLKVAAEILQEDICDIVMFHLGPDHKWYVVHRPEAIVKAVTGLALRALPGYGSSVSVNGTVIPKLPYHNVVWLGKSTTAELEMESIKSALSVLMVKLEEVSYP